MTNEFLHHHDPVKTAIAASLAQALSALTGQPASAEQASDAASLYQMLEKPPELSLGDYALPCFRYAKALRRNPNQIATALKESLSASLGSADAWLTRIEVAGAFLNLFTDKTRLAKVLLPRIADGSYFAAYRDRARAAKSRERVMIEFSQPNTHKEFHVGHLRNVCLGDSITRIYAYNGYEVVPVNYIGDEGTHVAKCLWQVAPLVKSAGFPTSRQSEWYGQRYVEANNKLAAATPEERQGYQQELSKILAEIEAKSGPYYDLWLRSRSECLADFDGIYQWLGVHFDHIFYESEVSEESQAIVDEYIAKGLFKESEGAIGVSMEEAGLGFFMARKSDGTSLYITKDLALARRKFEQFKIERSIYVVGSEQNFHFRQLFCALRLMGFPQAAACHHLSYAHVTLPEGKISSRKGNAFAFSQLVELLSAALAKHLEKYQGQWTPDEISATAHKLAVGSIKYGMLNADPQKELVFDAEAWTSFEGNTGPYLMYSYSRTASIIRKAAEQGFVADYTQLASLDHVLEHELLRQLYDFNDVCKQAAELYKPSLIATHLYTLCKSFNRFYAERSVINAPDAASRGARLALVTAFSLSLKEGLNLLGIIPPEKM